MFGRSYTADHLLLKAELHSNIESVEAFGFLIRLLRSHAADVKNRSGRRAHSDQGVGGAPTAANSSSGAAFGRARLNSMQPVPDSGDGNPPGFSARNPGKARN